MTKEKLQFVNFLSVFFIFEKLLKSKFFTFSKLFLLNMGFRRPLFHTFHIVFHIHVKKAGFTHCIIAKIQNKCIKKRFPILFRLTDSETNIFSYGNSRRKMYLCLYIS